MDWENKLKEIINDKKSGSSYIAKKVEALFPIIPDNKLSETLKKILKSHSSMAAVINKINMLCLERESLRIEKEKRNSIKIFNEFKNENKKTKD